MKLTKRLLAMLLLVCMVFSMLPAIALTASAATQTLSFSFTSCPSGWPSGSSSSANTKTYTVGGTAYTFSLGANVYYNTSKYLMLKSTTYLGLPAIDGYKLTKVVAKNSSGCSKSTKVSVCTNTSGTAVTGGSAQTWSTTSSTYTYNLSNTSANTMYYLYITTANSQIVSLDLTYESTATTKTLSSIAVSSNHRTFTVGGTFVKETVTATYSDSSTADVTNSATFSGYNMSSAGTQTVNVSYTEGGTTKSTSYTIDVVAPTPYTLTYSVNGDTSVISSGSYTSGTSVTLPTASDIAGYTFAGWVASAIGTETTTAPTVLTGSYTMPAANTTLYAVYTRTEGGSVGSGNYELVESAPSDWSGDYLIAYNSSTFADGRTGGTTGIGKQNQTVNPGSNLSGKTVAASWGDTYKVTIEACTGGYLLKTQDDLYNYRTTNSNGLDSTATRNTAANYPLTISFSSSSDIDIKVSSTAFHYNTQGYFRFYKDQGQSSVYLYKKTGSSGTTYYTTTVNTAATYYTLTYSVNPASSGSIDCEIANNGQVEEGTDVTLTATAAAHYTFASWTVSGTDEYVADGNELLVTMTDDVTVTANFTAEPTYTVTITPAAGGTMTASKLSGIYAGETVTLTATPDAHYSFNGWQCTAGGASISGNSFTMPAANVTVTGSFTEAAKYTVTYSVNGDTSVVDAKNDYVGTSYTLPTASDIAGYTFAGWVESAIGTETTTAPTVLTGNYTMPAANTTLYALFTRTEGGSGGGSSDYVKVTSTSDLTDGQYLIVYEDGEVALDSSLATIDAVEDTIAVTISNNTIPSNTTTDNSAFTFTASNGSFLGTNGKYIGHTGSKNTLNTSDSAMSNTVSIDDSGNAVINGGGSYVLRYNNTSGQDRFRFYEGTQQPIQLYKKGTGSSGTTYYTTTVLPPAASYTLTYSANPAAGGSITCASASGDSIEEGTAVSLTAAANPHYTFTGWTVNDVSEGSNATLNITMDSNMTVVANFTADPTYTVTLNQVTGGTLVANKIADIYAGEAITVTANPAAHYTFEEFNFTGLSGTEWSSDDNVLTFTMPANNVTVTPSFTEAAKYTVTFHSYSAESQAVTTAISDKYYSGDTVLAADVPAVAEPNGYVFVGWYGSTYAENASAPAYVTPAGTAIGSTALNFYAVYARPSAGSSPYFKLSMVVDDTTYYVGERVPTKTWLGNPTDAANAAQFGIDAGGYLYFMNGDTKTYVSNKSNATDLSFSTNKNDAMLWTVNETASGISFTTTATGERELAFNIQDPRFAAYQGDATKYPYIFTKIGGPSYDSYTTDPARVAPELTAVDDTVIFDRGRTLTFNVLTNDSLGYLTASQVTVTFTDLPTNAVDNGDGTFTFTPEAMQSEDVIFTYTITDKLDENNFATATVTLKPAERVYYDETDTDMFTFMDGNTNAWTTVTDPSLSSIDDIFAYEKENFLMYSGNSAKQVTVTKGDTPYVEFSFAGTGFEIIAAMTSTSGAAKIQVYTIGNETPFKTAIIDAYRGYAYDENNPVIRYTLRQVTRYKLVEDKYVAYTGAEGEDITDYTYYRDPATKEFVEGETWYAPGDASIAPASNDSAFNSYLSEEGTYVLIEQSSCWVQTNGNDANCYQIPILRMMGLTYGTYKVKVQPIYSPGFDRDNDGSYDFIFDGVNIYDPTGDAAYKYISLNDIVSENGFGSVELTPCEHPTSGNWTFFSAASGNATGEALNRGSFVKHCTECEAITDTAYFTVNAAADPTEINVDGSSNLSYTMTSNVPEVQALLTGETAAWTSSNDTVLTCSGSAATGIAEGIAHASLTLEIGGETYATGIKTADITVSPAASGFTATFHVPAGAEAPAAITQTGASITLPAAVAAPGSYDAHTYTFAGWVKSAVAYDDTAPAASDILAAGATAALTANTDFYALYTYQVGGSDGESGYYLATETPAVGDQIIIAFQNDGTWYAFPNATVSSGVTSISGTEIDVANGKATEDASVIFNVISKDGATALESNANSGNYIALNSAKLALNGWGNTKHIAFKAGTESGTYKIEGTSTASGGNFGRGITHGAANFNCSNDGGMDLYIFVYTEGGSGGSATYYTTNPGHKVFNTESATAPTCTEDGYTSDFICSECGMKLGDGEAIPALGHNYEITSDPSELNTTYTCSRCYDSYTEYYEYAVTYALQPGVEVSGGSRGEGENVNRITLPNAASIPDTYDAQTYTLVGWALTTSADSETNPMVHAKGAEVTISADTTFYPVYSFGSGSGSSYTLTDSLTDGDYMFGATYSSAIVVPNATTESGWLKYESFVPSNGVITNTDSLYVWTLTNQTDGGFTLKNKSTGDYFYVKSSTGSGTVTTDTNAHTVYATVAVAANKSFEIHDSSSATTSSGNQVTFNYNGNNGGYRNYAERATSDSMPNQFTFYKGSSGTTTYTFELQQKAPHYTATISPATLSLTFGASATLTATLCNNLVPVAAESVEFSSSNDSIVMVDEDTGYLVAGNTAGNATITVEMLAEDGEIYEATCTVYVSEQSNDITVNYIGSETGKVYNWGTRGTVATFLTAPTIGYYTGSYSYETLAAMSGDSGTGTGFYSSQLGSAIHNMLVAKQTTQTTYDGTKNLYAYTDCIESDTAHTSGYYTGKTLSSTWDSGSTWNREHVWPSSKCINTNHGADGADIMMLRPESASDNSGRGNTAFGESSGYYNPDAKYPSKAANVRGDVARNVLYTLMRWGNTTKFYGTNGVIESRDILLKWMNEDPVDTWELARNDAAQRITGVRNIFVDYPELAYKLLGAEMPESYSTPSSFGIVAKATYSATRPSNYEPVTEGASTKSVTRSASAHRAVPTTGIIGGAVVVDGKGNISTANDFKEYGPAYGVYLAPGQALVFTLNGANPSELAIGAKAVNATPAQLDVATLNGETGIVGYLTQRSIASAAEQYYALDLENLGWNENASDVIIVYNAGDGILDVTNLRYISDSDLTLTINQRDTQTAAKMLQIVYGAPVTDPDPIEPTDIDLSFDSAALALQSDIGMIFYVDEAVMNSAEGVYASFTKALYNENGEITGYAEAEDREAEFDEDLGKYFFRFEGINPAELGSAVTATLYGYRDGELVEGKTINYSVLGYINRMYAKTENAAFRTLLANLAAYGAAAQNYVSYNTANLVTDATVEGLAAYATDEAPELNSCTAQYGEGAVSFTGAYLSLREKVTVCYTIDASEYAGKVADLELRIYDGKTLLGTAAFEEIGGKYVASFSGLNALQMRTVLKAAVYAGDTCVSSTLDYSIESYAASKAAGNDALAALVNAMMNFGISAEEYFN